MNMLSEEEDVLSLSQQNAVDLHSESRAALKVAMTVGQTRYRSCQKYESVSLSDLPTGRHLLGVLFVTNLKSNLFTAATVHNTTDNNCTNSHAQNTAALQPNVRR
jgi:hypothetical protein